MGNRTPILEAHEFFRRGESNAEGWSQAVGKGREWESFYRERWQHDKVVRSTHGVNCTGSCSWNVYVKDGLITWEAQAVDYPSTGPGSPEYEPRGCPRGASFSWYTYSPSRVRYPYVRGELLGMWREARAGLGDPGAAGAEVTGDPECAARDKWPRGEGGVDRARARQGRVGPLVLAGGQRAHRRRARAHDRRLRPGPGGGVLPHPGDVHGVLLGWDQVPVDDRRNDPVVLRLVRGHADRVATGVRRPDRRAGVR